MSRPSEPVDTTSMSLMASASIFMIEPLPNCFSICDSAAANALDLLSSIAVPLVLWSASTAGQSWANTAYCINVHDCRSVDRACQSVAKTFRRQNDGESCVPRPGGHGLSHGRPPAEEGRPRGHRLQPHRC